MNRLKQLGIIILMLIIGGCEMNQEPDKKDPTAAANNLPDTPAFKDKFTREFMDAPEEVQDGYYLFKSKTDGYAMLFPSGGQIAEKSFEKHDEHEELITFGSKDEDKNISYSFQVIYENGPETENINANLDLLSSFANYTGEYETFENENAIFYYAKDNFVTDKREYHNYFSYIKSKKSAKAVRFSSSSFCTDEKKSCGANSMEVEEQLLMLMKSVDFLE
ncbi:hypothetical protein CVD23_17320 [Bacillus sp. V33-4]|nr:hypothetical protein CVD23_17320 [Bacillus sp. V33-4]